MKFEVSATDSILILQAIKNGNHNILRKVFKSGFNPNVCDENGEPLIFHPIVTGDLEMLKIFLSADECDVNIRNLDSRTPLLTAVALDDIGITKALIKAGVQVDCVDETGKSPLLLALEEGKFKIAEYLLKHGSDVNLIDNLGQSALHLLATGECNDCSKMVKIIFQCGYKIKEIDELFALEDLSTSLSEDKTKISRVINTFKESVKNIKALGTMLVNI